MQQITPAKPKIHNQQPNWWFKVISELLLNFWYYGFNMHLIFMTMWFFWILSDQVLTFHLKWPFPPQLLLTLVRLCDIEFNKDEIEVVIDLQSLLWQALYKGTRSHNVQNCYSQLSKLLVKGSSCLLIFFSERLLVNWTISMLKALLSSNPHSLIFIPV